MKKRTTEAAIGITMATIVSWDILFSPAYDDMHHLLAIFNLKIKTTLYGVIN